jgi:hypothetical protein
MKGSCLCGKVHYEITPPFKIFQYCHCSRCQKFSGSAFTPNLFVPPSQFQWLEGEDFVGRYELPEARYFATSFCKQCGSSLPWAVQGGQNIVVPVGTLDEDPEIQPQQNLFCGSRASWYISPADLPEHEGMPAK